MEDGGVSLYQFLQNNGLDSIDFFGLTKCQQDRFEIELGKVFRWLPLGGQKEEVGSAWVKAERTRCDECCGQDLKEKRHWAVVLGAAVVGPKVRPFAGIGLPFVYLRFGVSGSGSAFLALDPCPQSWSGGGCISVTIWVRVGFDAALPAWPDIYGEGGGGCKVCLKVDRLNDHAIVTFACSAYSRIGVRVGVGRVRYTHAWQTHTNTDEYEILTI